MVFGVLASFSKERLAVEANTSVEALDKEHKRLVQTKIKDSLSSFVPDIPGTSQLTRSHSRSNCSLFFYRRV